MSKQMPLALVPDGTPDSGLAGSSALFSPCRLYRYELWRHWRPGGICTFIGLNPSTADETKNDPTVRKCIAYAKRWGYGSLCMLNIFAWRATQPRDMMAAEEPIGPENNASLLRVGHQSAIVIAAWGRHGSHRGRGAEVRSMFPALKCLHLNSDGSPAHPLYLRGDSTPFALNDA